MATLPRGYHRQGVHSVVYRIIDYLGQFDLADDAYLTDHRWEWFMEASDVADRYRVNFGRLLQEHVVTHPAWPAQTDGRKAEILAQLANCATIPGLTALRARAKEMALAFDDEATRWALRRVCVADVLAPRASRTHVQCSSIHLCAPIPLPRPHPRPHPHLFACAAARRTASHCATSGSRCTCWTIWSSRSRRSRSTASTTGRNAIERWRQRRRSGLVGALADEAERRRSERWLEPPVECRESRGIRGIRGSRGSLGCEGVGERAHGTRHEAHPQRAPRAGREGSRTTVRR